MCGKTGQDAVYHCEECGFDAHPQCAVGKIKFDDLYKKVVFGIVDDDDDDHDRSDNGHDRSDNDDDRSDNDHDNDD